MDNKEIYRQVISDHNRNPFCYGKIKSYTHHAKGENPNKGDEIEIWLEIENDIIRDCGFEGAGGAVFTASASIMMELIKNHTVDDAKKQFDLYVSIFRDACSDEEALGKLIVFTGIREFPERVKCAVLPWHTMVGALENTSEIISTEFFN
jgi:nitrogen fixation NifU-like protein